MKNLNLLGVLSLGVVIGWASPRGMIKPWFEDNIIREGDKVRYNKNIPFYSKFYNQCEKITVIGLQSVEEDNQAWVLLERCDFNNNKISTDVISVNDLIKENHEQ